MYVKEWEKLENTVKTLFFKLDINNQFKSNLTIENKEIKIEIDNFNSAMDNDFNTANAITALQAVTRLANITLRKNEDAKLLNELYHGLIYMTDILGLDFNLSPLTKELKEIYHDWQEARRAKDFEKADKLREILMEKGVL